MRADKNKNSAVSKNKNSAVDKNKNSAEYNSFHFNDSELEYIQRVFAKYDRYFAQPKKEILEHNIRCNGIRTEKSCREIADRLGCTKQSVSQSCRRAMTKAEKILDRLGAKDYLDGDY